MFSFKDDLVIQSRRETNFLEIYEPSHQKAFLSKTWRAEDILKLWCLACIFTQFPKITVFINSICLDIRYYYPPNSNFHSSLNELFSSKFCHFMFSFHYASFISEEDLYGFLNEHTYQVIYTVRRFYSLNSSAEDRSKSLFYQSPPVPQTFSHQNLADF